MRVRTAKTLAQRIDMYYFTRARGLKRWRILLSVALPIAAVLWVAGLAAAGSRKAYSAGPVSGAHAFVENKCEKCHAADHAAPAERKLFRMHTTQQACVTCHAAPKHAANETTPPECSACHEEHRGRVQLAKMDDGLCTSCHGDLKTTHGQPKIATAVRAFPDGHPQFAAVRDGAPDDPAKLKFNHAVHLKDALRGPKGPEKLECAACHRPQMLPAVAGAKRPVTTGLMAPVTFKDQCARCHPLFFDERLDYPAPHDHPEKVMAFVRQSLADYIRANPGDISKPDSAFRRVPLNFPRPPEPPARNAAEWVERRASADEKLLWDKTCAECHLKLGGLTSAGYQGYEKTGVPARWMPRAAFNHLPHRGVACESCHGAARASTRTSDVLLPKVAACTECHASSKTENRCFECHRYHDWTEFK